MRGGQRGWSAANGHHPAAGHGRGARHLFGVAAAPVGLGTVQSVLGLVCVSCGHCCARHGVGSHRSEGSSGVGVSAGGRRCNSAATQALHFQWGCTEPPGAGDGRLRSCGHGRRRAATNLGVTTDLMACLVPAAGGVRSVAGGSARAGVREQGVGSRTSESAVGRGACCGAGSLLPRAQCGAGCVTFGSAMQLCPCLCNTPNSFVSRPAQSARRSRPAVARGRVRFIAPTGATAQQ